MKKTTTLLTLALLSSVILHAQWWGKHIKGNGNVTEIERSVGDYDMVAVAGNFDVYLVAGTEGELTLKGESNLLEHIKTEVKDGKLIIKTKNNVELRPSNWKSKALSITVPIEDISAATLSGSGDIVGKTLIKANKFHTAVAGSGDITLEVDAQSVSAAVSGSGDLRLEGTAQDFEAKVAGSGDIHAFDLRAENVTSAVSGSGDVRVSASGLLKARVSGSGDVHYRGNPDKIDSKVSGSGDVSRS